MTFSAADAQSYKDQGFYSPITVVDSGEAARYRQKFDELEQRVGKEEAQIGLVDQHFKSALFL